MGEKAREGTVGKQQRGCYDCIPGQVYGGGGFCAWMGRVTERWWGRTEPKAGFFSGGKG